MGLVLLILGMSELCVGLVGSFLSVWGPVCACVGSFVGNYHPNFRPIETGFVVIVRVCVFVILFRLWLFVIIIG